MAVIKKEDHEEVIRRLSLAKSQVEVRNIARSLKAEGYDTSTVNSEANKKICSLQSGGVSFTSPLTKVVPDPMSKTVTDQPMVVIGYRVEHLNKGLLKVDVQQSSISVVL